MTEGSTPGSSFNSSSLPASRLLFIDMYRGIITLIMVQGHVTNSTILHSLRGTTFFHYLNVFNGMVAPSFVFIAGFAISLIFEKKWEDLVHFKRPFWMQIRRYLFILALGYWLHLSTWSFLSLLQYNREQMLFVLRADILHVIGLSLLFSLILGVILQHRKRMMIILLTLG